MFKCNICNIEFSSNYSSKRHIKRRHNVVEVQSSKHRCAYEDCHFTFNRVKEYRDHLKDEHHFENPVESHTFKTKSEYTSWIEDLQSKTNANYLIRTSKTLTDGSRKSYLVCNRSGCFTTQGKGIRQMKSQGTCKSGVTCPSDIELVELNGQCSVQYRSQHLGHEFILGLLRLPKTIRSQVAEKLGQGLDDQRVLADLRATAKDEIHKEHLLTKKDLRNIRASFGISLCDDEVSVDCAGLLDNIESSINIQKTRELLEICLEQLIDGHSYPDSVLELVNGHLESVSSLLLLNRNSGPAKKKPRKQPRLCSAKKKGKRVETKELAFDHAYT